MQAIARPFQSSAPPQRGQTEGVEFPVMGEKLARRRRGLHPYRPPIRRSLIPMRRKRYAKSNSRESPGPGSPKMLGQTARSDAMYSCGSGVGFPRAPGEFS